MYHLGASSPTKTSSAADDTNIFVLLLHFTFTGDIKSQVHLQPTDKESSVHVIGIAATYQSHIETMLNILAAHGLSGYDTVYSYFGIGKKQL